MNVVCRGPWRAESLLWQPRPGAWAYTVACHAVFELAPGASPIVERPLPLPGGDERALVEPWGPVAPAKLRPEVVVVGHAHAGPGKTVTALSARLAVGGRDKILQIHGDTYIAPEGGLFGPAPFAHMPLRWERAAGGPGTSNPLGVRKAAAAIPDWTGHAAFPNFRPQGTSITGR